jgi:hypothetical protein
VPPGHGQRRCRRAADPASEVDAPLVPDLR